MKIMCLQSVKVGFVFGIKQNSACMHAAAAGGRSLSAHGQVRMATRMRAAFRLHGRIESAWGYLAGRGGSRVEVRAYAGADVASMVEIWNEVVRDGIAFPQEDELDEEAGAAFFARQTHCGVAVEDGAVLGLYILHPNNEGRCGHIANASYAVSSAARGKGVGRLLVEDSLVRGAAFGFRILQFNAVVASNAAARHLYEKLGFVSLGAIPGGFRLPDGSYADICLYYHLLGEAE